MSSPTSSQRFVEHDDSQLGATNAEHYERGDGDGIPFLVTHWLEQFANVDNQEISTQEQAEAFEKIRRATSDLASAFSTLGAYGTINAPLLSASHCQLQGQRNASYSDRSRQWSRLPENHLNNLINCVTTATSAADCAAMASNPVDLIVAAGERVRAQADGRSAMDAIVLDDTATDETPPSISSSLLSPVLLNYKEVSRRTRTTIDVDSEPQTPTVELPMVSLGSSLSDFHSRTSVSMRRLLSLREKIRQDEDEMSSLRASISRQEEVLKSLEAKRSTLTNRNGEVDESQSLAMSDEIKESEQNCHRVIAQLRRKVIELDSSNRARLEEMKKVEADAWCWNRKGSLVDQNYRDPFRAIDQCRANGNRVGGNPILDYIIHRQRGKGASRPQNGSTCTLVRSKDAETTNIRKTIFSTRLSHAATINTHLSFPVYCLRFDRTGRYFVTGADDYLIKVFYLGAAQSCRDRNDRDGSRQLRCNYGANARGAVLVCTLRGHAGVINDIDVSSDNCFLATASVDGDCRIWGLKDGCPVAVLRGHKGGANMVSWSTLTPYRLITTGSDGYARMWDIREATLRRYGAIIGMRPEYRLILTDKEKEVEKEKAQESQESSAQVQILPPLPIRENSTSRNVPVESGENDTESAPPRGAAAPPMLAGNGQDGDLNRVAQDANRGDGNDNIVPGTFVANDNIDEGVKLLSKYQHGAPESSAAAGPGTRSRRAAVNVICVARCPIGGHFATGSDDGICRVWEDSDDHCVALVDMRYSANTAQHTCSTLQKARRSRRTSLSNGLPLLKLMGHVSAITDLAYSRLGDRLLSASQKDGVVRVWSVGTKLDLLSVNADSIIERGVTQIVIKLTNPLEGVKSNPQQSRRRGPGNSSRSEASKVSCDVAVWTHDDTKIVTSQSILVKQSGNEIQPGSQYLFLWDSHTGHCLVGISGAHTMQCPVVIPHPVDVSLVCSAGADGIVNIWDWNVGTCVFSHINKVEFGPPEGPNRPKTSGYLDGAFSPDGTGLVLTDDNGRVTILDSSATAGSKATATTQLWMREQYFANDYYELFYDSNGYCIERGSEQPPHLAPKGVRSTHTGAPLPDHVNETFLGLVGPIPLPEESCRWHRDAVRERAQRAGYRGEEATKPRTSKVRSGVREFDPVNTIVIRGPGHVEASEKRVSHARGPQRQRADPGEDDVERSMSSNFRWGDYEDLMRDQALGNDDDEIESDDEEFEPTAARGSVADNGEDSEDLDPDDDYSSPRRVGRGQGTRRTGGERSRRAQRRAQLRDNQFVEIGSDDEMVAQFVSTNTTPSGPFLRDYTVNGHLWRLTGNGVVNRRWLLRVESDTSYSGQRIYSPQVGDSVVYIPRAHFETIKEFPNLTPPWQSWPNGTVWPVVRCCIRGVRYRFPFEGYSSRRVRSTTCKSIVAILNLELTGIPELSGDSDFLWPTPSFVHPTRSHCFEISVFENDKCEFIIPELLYTTRLLALERKLNDCDRRFQGLSIQLYYSTGDSEQEDQEMQSYPATVKNVNTDESHQDAHLQGSGFGVFEVECEGYTDFFSPWEVMVDEATPDRPALSQDDKKLVNDALERQLQKSSVREYFSDPVDLVRYSDYLNMVEVPMDLMFVKQRLQSEYYATKFSVLADVKLIRDNCIKYNGDEGFLPQLSSALYDEFLKSVLSEVEQQQIVPDAPVGQVQEQPLPSLRIRLRTRNNPTGDQSNEYNSRIQPDNGVRSRVRTRRDSALENLPPPQDNRLGQREVRPGHRSTRSRASAPGSDVLGRIADPRNSDGSTPEAQEHDQNANGEPTEDATQTADDESSGLSDQDVSTTLQSQSVSHFHASSIGDSRSTRNRECQPRTSNGRGSTGRSLRSRGNAARATVRYAESDEESMSSGPEDVDLGSEPAEENWEDGSDRESDDPEEEWDGPDLNKRRPPNIRARQYSRRSSNPRDRLEDTEPGSPRRSKRAVKSSHGAYEEKESDFDLESEFESVDESEEEQPPKRRARQKVTYAEVPSDFDESYDGSDDSEEPLRGKAQRSRVSKRQRGNSKPMQQSHAKRTKRDGAYDLPDIKKWPDIEIKSISQVANGVLARLRQRDTERAFAVPVVESYPELAESYEEAVLNPIDLRTIEEDRLPIYQTIDELREDLELMFSNCCTFNKSGNHYWKYSKAIWESLTEIFRESCKEANVLLPRRF